MNATYSPSPEAFFDKNLKLNNGDYYSPNEDGIVDSVAYTSMDEGQIAFGDLNNDGIDDAAVIFATSGGGTGYFIDLVVVYNKNGEPQNIASTALGDRVVVKHISIKNGAIELHLLTHRESDGQCCPTKKTSLKYIVKGGVMLEITGTKFY